jgi:Ser/Thr protein kinase RdoA (MazF antagonist)
MRDDFAITMTAKAHGMDGTLVAPDWPPVGLAEVRALLSQYSGFREPVEILSVSPRPFSAASVVATQAGRAFIKRHHRTVRDAEGLLEEHRFMAHLLDAGASVPRVFRSVSGETAIEMGEWTYEIHEAPESVDIYRDAQSWTPFRTVEHAYSAGNALARMHLAAECFAAPRRKQRPLVASFTIFAARNPAEEMDRYITKRPALSDYLRTRNCRDEALELLAPFHAELLPLLHALPSLWTHNDLHASNLLWSDDTESAQAAAIIDFGLADRTNAVHDLAHAITRNIVEWLALVGGPAHPKDVPMHLDHLGAMLTGYESVRPLSEEEAAALAPMTALCDAEFALSETDYLLNVLHSEEQAPMACEGWLVGHARWFRRARGKQLLNAIRGWALHHEQKRHGAAQE